MIFKKNTIFTLILLISIFIYICSLFFVDKNYFLSFLTFIYFSTIPGYLFLLSFKIKHLDFWSKMDLSVGLSLSIFLLPGLLYNWSWFQLVKTAPLEKNLLLIFNGIIFLILFTVSYIRNNEFEYTYNPSKKLLLHFLYFIIPPLLTLTTVLGAYQLNNSNNNFLAIFSISSIALMMLLSIIFHKRINDNFFPWQVYWYSLSLLLSLSLRSLYVSGWDIQSEFKMFQITNNFGVWNPDNWNHAYNACLSITLLPTIFSKLTAFPDEYIFKLLFQILFAITPVVLFLTFKKHFVSVLSFLAVIYIISQPLFIQPLTALIRQEVAYIFFVLMMFVLFKTKLSSKVQGMLFTIFGLGMVVSHYSTTYITIILLVLTYVLLAFYRVSEKIVFIEWIYKKIYITSQIKFYRYYLNPFLIIVLIGFTFYWYGFVNNQLGQVKEVARNGLARMNELFESDVKSTESKKAITFLQQDKTTTEEIENYINMILVKVDGDSYRLYDSETYKNLKSIPINPAFVNPKFVSPMNKNIILVLEVVKQILKLLVMLGPLYLFVFYFRKNSYPREYVVLCAVGVVIIIVMTFHPSLGLSYNLSRFYLQLLFYLSLPAIVLLAFVLYPLKKYSINIIAVFIISLFLYLTGVVFQFVGGEARMNFNNFGDDYNKFYTHKEELASAEWLSKNVNSRFTIFADLESNLRITRILDRSLNTNVVPQLIYKDAYVYGSFANVVNNITIIHYGGLMLSISFPQQFLEQQKDIIYSNGGSKIYR